MNIILADVNRENLLPFTFMRPVADIRCGIMTIAEKWNYLSGDKCSYLTESYLSKKYPVKIEKENLVVNSSVLVNHELYNEAIGLKTGCALLFGDIIIAINASDEQLNNYTSFAELKITHKSESAFIANNITYPWDIFKLNDTAIKSDFELLTKGRKSQPISNTNTAINPAAIFIEEGAVVECSILNGSTGPIYIGKDAEIMEGCAIRGPFALGDHAVLKMLAKIYGATTIGPHCKVGGEVSNSVIFAYSNKAHDGFLGNSVIAEWCNLGADTNNSNLKNNYGVVKVYNYVSKKDINTGLQFCGLMMGDHSKAAINTMFNTGTVVGVSANVFGGGFPPKFIPSFAWGGFDETVFQLDKAIELADQVYKRREMAFDKLEQEILSHVNMLELRLPSV